MKTAFIVSPQQKTGDCVGFTGAARLVMKHGVLKTDPVRELPVTLPANTAEEEKWMDGVRVVHTHTNTHT